MKNKKMCLLKGLSLLLIPLFLLSNVASAKTYEIATNTLARSSFVQAANEEGEAFDMASSALAQTWVTGIIAKVAESNGAITLRDAEVELIKQTELWAQAGNVSDIKRDKMITALRHEFAKECPVALAPPIERQSSRSRFDRRLYGGERIYATPTIRDSPRVVVIPTICESSEFSVCVK